MLTILVGVATREREIMLERQREGAACRRHTFHGISLVSKARFPEGIWLAGS